MQATGEIAATLPADVSTSGTKTAGSTEIISSRSISVQEARDILGKGNTAIFVDVRSQAKYDTGHIEGAMSIPIDDLLARLEEIPVGNRIIVYADCL